MIFFKKNHIESLDVPNHTDTASSDEVTKPTETEFILSTSEPVVPEKKPDETNTPIISSKADMIRIRHNARPENGKSQRRNVFDALDNVDIPSLHQLADSLSRSVRQFQQKFPVKDISPIKEHSIKGTSKTVFYFYCFLVYINIF